MNEPVSLGYHSSGSVDWRAARVQFSAVRLRRRPWRQRVWHVGVCSVCIAASCQPGSPPPHVMALPMAGRIRGPGLGIVRVRFRGAATSLPRCGQMVRVSARFDSFREHTMLLLPPPQPAAYAEGCQQTIVNIPFWDSRELWRHRVPESVSGHSHSGLRGALKVDLVSQYVWSNALSRLRYSG